MKTKKGIEFNRSRGLRYRNSVESKPKTEARIILRQAVKDGIILKMPCRDCGSIKSQGHHPDYSKPLAVIWLCSYHHKQEHRRIAGIIN